MHSGRRTALSLFIGWIFLVSPAAADEAVDFAHDVLPILKSRCAECHTNGKYKGGFSLDTREAAIKSGLAPGKATATELWKRVTSDDPDVRMPPKGKPLTPQETARLRDWIDKGLSWQPGFSFKVAAYVAPLKPRRPEIPASRPGLEHPIDRILADYAARNKIPQPPPLDDETFLRRAYLDAIGLLPTPQETASFLADAEPNKRSRLIRRLLDERRAYAEHWLSFWNDLLRNDYSGTGFITNGRKQITAWLYRSLYENEPYDRFARQLVSPGKESDGFLAGITWRGDFNSSQTTAMQFSQNLSQVFFGVNMKCASCHDSFIDGWKLTDAYGLAAAASDRPLEIHRCDKKTGVVATPAFLFPELGGISAKTKSERLAQLADLVVHPDNGRFTRTIANRLWQRLMGRGIVHPVDVMGNRPWSEDLLDHLATRLVETEYDLKKLVEHIMTSRAYQSRAVLVAKEPSGDDDVFRGPEIRRMTAEQFLDAVNMVTLLAPDKISAPVKPPPFDESIPAERRFVRASLMKTDSLMQSLGRPPREQVVTTRPDQLTTLQAMDLANGKILDDLLTRGANNLMRRLPKNDADAAVDDVYRRALSRLPTPGERIAARELLGSPMTAPGVADLLWAVFMLPEFQLVR